MVVNAPDPRDYPSELAGALEAYSAELAACWQVRTANHEPFIRFDRPTGTLPVSLTAGACALRCAHCNGVYLKQMHTAAEALTSGASSALISGGCDPDGRVPLGGHLAEVAMLKQQGKRLNWHVGFCDEASIREIAPFVDLVSFDIVGDSETAREVYGLDYTLDDYLRTFDMLARHVPVVPHITIGLRAGRLSGEEKVLQALALRHIEQVVFLILIPTPGTQYANCPAPALGDVARIMTRARLGVPQARLYLGCMRPRNPYRAACDELALRAGFNVIVNPLSATIKLAGELGLAAAYGDECCALE